MNTALELDHDSVRLLRCAGGRRTELGVLRLDDPRFDARLAALRSGVCGDNVDVEVVLPPALVLFLDVGEAAEDEVEGLVADETPCALDDLVIGRGGALVAAVERTTLEEARDFARAHGFRPAAFAARPENRADGVVSFRYEPLPPPSFRTHRAPADPVAPEAGEVGATATGHPAPAKQVAPPAIPAHPESTGAEMPATHPGGSEQDTPPREAPSGSAEPPRATGVAQEPVPDAGAGEPDSTSRTEAVPQDADEPVISWRTMRPNGPDDDAHRPVPAETAPEPDELDASALSEISFRAARRDAAEPLPPVDRLPDDEEAHTAYQVSADAAAGADDDATDEPELPVAFRHAGTATAPGAENIGDPAPPVEPKTRARDAPHGRPQERDAGRPATAVQLAAPGKKAAAAVAQSLTAHRVAPANSEADALTIFGARGEPAPRARGFTLLHAAAAALAAGVLFAAYGLFQGDVTEPDIVDIGDVATDAIDPLTQAEGTVDEPGADAPSGEAGTGLAALGPTVSVAPEPRPAQPPPAAQNDATIEAPRSDLAAPVTLPEPIRLETPAPLAAPVLPARPGQVVPGAFTPPPPPGTVFDMDERGLVRPTEDGAMTPTGVLVHAGPPATVPPAAALTPSGDPAPEAPAPEDPAPTGEELAGTRDDAALAPAGEESVATAADVPRTSPPARPEDAVAAPVVTALAAGDDTPRPRVRPDSVSGAAAAAADADAGAEPDFDALGQQARTQTAAAAAGIASTAPRAAQPPPPEPEGRANVAVQPSLPTRASIAERATVQDALRLNRVNLIGVYGTASDRRALIRLPTGRYIKVKVGDRVDGGRVASIQSNRVEYVKGGQRFDLSLPSG